MERMMSRKCEPFEVSEIPHMWIGCLQPVWYNLQWYKILTNLGHQVSVREWAVSSGIGLSMVTLFGNSGGKPSPLAMFLHLKLHPNPSVISIPRFIINMEIKLSTLAPKWSWSLKVVVKVLPHMIHLKSAPLFTVVDSPWDVLKEFAKQLGLQLPLGFGLHIMSYMMKMVYGHHFHGRDSVPGPVVIKGLEVCLMRVQ